MTAFRNRDSCNSRDRRRNNRDRDRNNRNRSRGDTSNYPRMVRKHDRGSPRDNPRYPSNIHSQNRHEYCNCHNSPSSRSNPSNPSKDRNGQPFGTLVKNDGRNGVLREHRLPLPQPHPNPSNLHNNTLPHMLLHPPIFLPASGLAAYSNRTKELWIGLIKYTVSFFYTSESRLHYYL